MPITQRPDLCPPGDGRCVVETTDQTPTTEGRPMPLTPPQAVLLSGVCTRLADEAAAVLADAPFGCADLAAVVAELRTVAAALELSARDDGDQADG